MLEETDGPAAAGRAMAWPERLRRVVLVTLLALPPILAGMLIAGTEIDGSTLWPWSPAMIDLDVYLRTGRMALEGQDFFQAQGLPWIYPPFAALLTLPFALLPELLAEFVWIVLSVGALAAIFHRQGLTGWKLSLVLTLTVLFVQPVRLTIGYGQLGIFLVAAAALDSLPGRSLMKRRILPEGWITGLATAVKLTPAVVAAHNFFSGRRQPGLVAFFTFVAATAVGFLTLPAESQYYWGRLISGESGMNSAISYVSNQSVMGVWTRVTGSQGSVGLLLSGLVLVLGLVAGVRAHRSGEPELGICLAGFTSLLASPISWSHHFVWVVPLAVVLIQRKGLPRWFRAFGLGYSLWVAVAPFMWMPGGAQVEFDYTWFQQSVASVGMLAGVAMLVLALVAVPGRSRLDSDMSRSLA
jgi:alpha-1,2-mannosyltransferase